MDAIYRKYQECGGKPVYQSNQLNTYHNILDELYSIAESADIQQVKDYLDTNFMKKITLDNLASGFYFNKYYLMKLFKNRYGVAINVYYFCFHFFIRKIFLLFLKKFLTFYSRSLIDIICVKSVPV